jgi:hypothetical protein
MHNMAQKNLEKVDKKWNKTCMDLDFSEESWTL